MKSKCTSIVSIIELQINVQKKSQDKSNVIEAKQSLENYTYSIYIYRPKLTTAYRVWVPQNWAPKLSKVQKKYCFNIVIDLKTKEDTLHNLF